MSLMMRQLDVKACRNGGVIRTSRGQMQAFGALLFLTHREVDTVLQILKTTIKL